MQLREKITATLLASLLLLAFVPLHAEAPRKVKVQVAPVVPEIAERMGLKGVVRLEIEIAADGTVKSFKPLGGHPILIQSAEQAIKKWKFEAGSPSKQVIEFNFQHGK